MGEAGVLFLDSFRTLTIQFTIALQVFARSYEDAWHSRKYVKYSKCGGCFKHLTVEMTAVWAIIFIGLESVRIRTLKM